jgi:HlyD family secretion protein
VSIDNADHALKANMTANAEIVLEEHVDTLHIPEAAITYDAQRTATVQVHDPKAPASRRTVTVQVGISNGTRTEITGGLSEGDRVVLPG